MWIYANPNPCRTEEPDCVVRAIAIVTGKTWHEVHGELCRLSGERCTMPSVNWLWEIYLRKHGVEKFLLPDTCPACLTVREFCRRYREGTYLVGTGTHAVAIRDGNYIDAWDSGDETLTYFFRKKG
jgi:hypothetical protein